MSTQEARLELDKLISRRLLLLGVPCDLPVLTVAQGANDENGLPETIPDIAEQDRDLAEDRGAEHPVIFTQEHGLRGALKRLRPRPKPPEKPGKAEDPFGPVTHLSRTLDTPDGTFDYNAAWRYDAACHLTVRLACNRRRRFVFETRCDSFAHAIEHLGATLSRRGMSLALKGFTPGANWIDSAPDCETLRLPDGRLIHALSLDTAADPVSDLDGAMHTAPAPVREEA